MNRRRKTIDKLAQLLYPQRCVICDGLLEPGERRLEHWDAQTAGSRLGVHSRCQGQLRLIGGAVCMHCGRPLTSVCEEYCLDCGRRMRRQESVFWDGKTPFELTQGRAVLLYEGMVKRSLYRFKYGNRREYARAYAAAAVYVQGEWLRRIGVEVVVPVPMYRWKKWRRGYDQAELFARELAELLGIACASGLVERCRNTRPQKSLNDVERKNNLKNAFQTRKNIVQYDKVLLVDDIYTTGCTAENVARILKESGVRQVYFLAVSIAMG